MSHFIREHVSSPAQLSARPRLGSALFHYYCTAHRQRSIDRSPVTIYQNRWAFCLHGYGNGHDWAAIEPISDVDLLRFGPTFLGTREPALASA